jgi:hypothetical protein
LRFSPLAECWRLSFEDFQMETIKQVIAALYVALGEAAGGPKAMCIANRALRDAIADGVIDDPLAIEILECLSHDEDDAVLEAVELPAWWDRLCQQVPAH